MKSGGSSEERADNAFRCSVRFGVRKDKERVIEKARKNIYSLTDMNRATITARSPMVLAAAFHCTCREVDRAGGKLVMIKNGFLAAGENQKSHAVAVVQEMIVNFEVKDWVVEVVFALPETIVLRKRR